MQRFLAPRAIAVVGASSNPLAIGGQPVRQLKRHGFAGGIYPVNPNRDVIQDLKCFPSVSKLPDGVDVAIVAVAAPHVTSVVEQCGHKGIPYVVVLSSGFADAGEDGARLQDELVQCARRYGIRLLGPNCVGYASMAEQLYAGFGAFFEYEFAPGPVGFVTQSGGVGGSLLTVLDEQGTGFRHFVHTGNAADMDIETMLHAFLDDPGTGVLLAYIEGLAEGSGFADAAARALAEGKPLIAWKAGKSAASGSAVVSHTGRLAGDIERYRAVFAHHGVIEVDDSADLADVLRLARVGCCPAGERVGVVSVSGGAGVIAADCLAQAEHLALAEFTPETEARIAAVLPGFATSRNPVDVTAQIFNQPDLFEQVVSVLCEQREVDVIVACVASVHGAVGERIAQAIVRTQQAVDVPIVAVWASREQLNGAAFRLLEAAGVPLFRAPERALRALDRIAVLGRARRRVRAPVTEPMLPGWRPLPTADWQRTTEFDVLSRLASCGLRIPAQRMVVGEQEAMAAVEALGGGPVVMKIQSPDIAHKARVGGVRLGVRGAAEAAEAYRALSVAGAAVGGAEIRGVVVQEMVPGGVEVICGYLHDPVLGDFLLCGGGGSEVERVRDMQLVPMPATAPDLQRAVMAARVGSALAAVENGVDAVVDVLLRLQHLVADQPCVLGELEINPVIVGPSGAVAVDALAVPRPTEATTPAREMMPA